MQGQVISGTGRKRVDQLCSFLGQGSTSFLQILGRFYILRYRAACFLQGQTYIPDPCCFLYLQGGIFNCSSRFFSTKIKTTETLENVSLCGACNTYITTYKEKLSPGFFLCEPIDLHTARYCLFCAKYFLRNVQKGAKMSRNQQKEARGSKKEQKW